MRAVFLTLVAATALIVTAGAFPRPLPAAQDDQKPSQFSLLQDIQQLKKEIRKLRGRNEALEHQIERNRESRKKMYEDLDERLQKLETKAGLGDAENTQQVTELASGTGDSSAGTNENEAKQAYEAAFDQLRDGEYDGAITGFEAFVEKYSDSSYIDNAWYWLGQARYVQGDLSDALTALQQVVDKYPDSGKMPSTLFRMGMIQQTLDKPDRARKTFARILDDYPDSESADRARQRLQDM